MSGKNALEYDFKKKEHIVTMADKVSTKIDVDSIQDDIRLLFQHLVLAAGEDSDVASIFKCKLSSFLSSLFDFCLTDWFI